MFLSRNTNVYSNPKNYNDDQDARPYDPRLRAPVRPVEIEVDHETGMKNYIANGRGDWATSAAFVKYSFTQSIHHGRLYTSGSGMFSKGNDDDLAEALRLLGQGLHTLEDFGAHTNYVELSLLELGNRDVFPLVGRNTQINVKGKKVWPLVTGTFGMVDFYHSVIGEATDHFTQSELSEMDNAMGVAEQAAQSSNPLTTLVKLLSKIPGTGGLADEATRLQAASQHEARRSGPGTRSVDDFSSSRGLDDYSSSRGPGDFPGANQYGSNSHDAYNSYGQQQQGYQQGGYNNYQQPGYGQAPPQPQWGQPQHDPYNQGSSWNQPPPSQQHNQWQQPAQHDQYSSQAWQQPTAQPQQHSQFDNSSAWQAPASSTPQSSSQVPPVSGQQVAKPQGLEGMPDFDPGKLIKQIYPILVFRDKVVRSISAIIEKIPGLEALVERIVETLTVFIFSLLAPFVRPVLEAMQKTLKSSSEGVTDWNAKHQYEVWDDPNCSDPTHSMLSKDHFSNILNSPAGMVAGEILKYIAPRVLYAWEHPEVPVDRVMQDVDSIFHHPALRDERNECHRNMFKVVRDWANGQRNLNGLLNFDAVRAGKNHIAGVNDHAGHGSTMGAAHGSGAGHGPTAAGGYGAYLQQAEHVVSGFTGIGGHQSNSGYGGGGSSNQGGLSGIFSQAESFLGGGKPSGGHSSNSGGGGGGLGDMLSMASKLPGLGQYSSQLNNFNKLSSAFGGGRRDIPGEELDSEGRSRTRAVIPGDDGDYGDSDKYMNLGLSSVGGANEFYESQLRANRAAPTPSPGPLPPPSGYEMYSQGGNYGEQQQGYNTYGGQGQGYAHQSRQEYDNRSGGYGGGYSSEQTGGYGSQQFSGHSDGYYRQ